jgi:hypothetical protein
MKRPKRRSRAKDHKTARPKSKGALVVRANPECDPPAPAQALPSIKPQSSDSGRTEAKPSPKPYLIIRDEDLTWTAKKVGELFRNSGRIFDRAGPVKIVQTSEGIASAHLLDADRVVVEAHSLSHPVRIVMTEGEQTLEGDTLPQRVANLYLCTTGEYELPPLEGICTSPLLSEGGHIRIAQGYDSRTQFWCAGISLPPIKDHPTFEDATAALETLRRFIQTFPFADSARLRRKGSNVDLVDQREAPGLDESSIIVGFLTAICRPSLSLAPGILIRAPEGSGTGTGKGLLVNALVQTAFNVRPTSFTRGSSTQELDKRLATDLIRARPHISIDNVNSTTLKSDLLAQSLTEEQIESRLLGRSEMRDIKSSALITVTGNATILAEDLIRRFIACDLDARQEEAYHRQFEPGFRQEIINRRGELLTAALTIWRWGQQNRHHLKKGISLGSFEEWAAWCRDPVLSLGCADPVKRIAEFSRDDPVRREIAEIFHVWYSHHGDAPTTIAMLAAEVRALLNPYKKSASWVTSRLTHLQATRGGGFVFERVDKFAQYGFHTYRVRKAEEL